MGFGGLFFINFTHFYGRKCHFFISCLVTLNFKNMT